LVGDDRGMQALARAAIRYRWFIIGGWVVFIVVVQVIAGAAGGSSYKNVFTLPHTETQTVLDLLKGSGQGGQAGQAGTVVVHARTGALDPAAAPPGLVPALKKVCADGDHVAVMRSPWVNVQCRPNGSAIETPAQTNGHSPLLSADDKLGLVAVTWVVNENDVSNFTGVYDLLNPLNSDTVQYEFTGTAFANLAERQHGVPPELFGFAAALIVLAIVFRTIGAAALPLLSAAAALGSGLGIMSLLSHAMNVATFAPQLSQLMVIGVGVDYALFIVTRHRRNMQRGMPVAESIRLALNTSGRAVLFAAATVCVAILGLCALGVSFLYGVAVGTAIAVALTMLASLTLLPAVLSLLGDRVLPRRIRREVRAGNFRSGEHHTRWARWARFLTHNKLVLAVLAAAVIVVLAIPFFSMRLGRADPSNDPRGSTTRTGFELISHAPGFGPGYNSTLELVVDGPGAADGTYLAGLGRHLAALPDVNPTSILPVPLSNRLALVTFKTRTTPQDEATTRLVKSLRSNVVPTLEQGTPNQIYVFGQTAVFVDFARVLASKMPLFFTAIIGLSFVLLMLAFRSLVIPLTAAAMNLFAAGASFGVVVAVFQWGWFSDSLGIGKGGPIEPFLPVMFFAILFGLSMDYQVFLVSRMHEEWVHTGENGRAIRVGQAETGGIITAAALIMIAVFAGFLLGNERAVKMFGLGLGSAIFIDAFVLRTVLVPAMMHVLGGSNWYYPRWLDRITPQVSVEPADDGWSPEPGDEAEWERQLAGVLIRRRPDRAG
jgi:RND superfamily putative drug exporter